MSKTYTLTYSITYIHTFIPSVFKQRVFEWAYWIWNPKNYIITRNEYSGEYSFSRYGVYSHVCMSVYICVGNGFILCILIFVGGRQLKLHRILLAGVFVISQVCMLRTYMCVGCVACISVCAYMFVYVYMCIYVYMYMCVNYGVLMLSACSEELCVAEQQFISIPCGQPPFRYFASLFYLATLFSLLHLSYYSLCYLKGPLGVRAMFEKEEFFPAKKIDSKTGWRERERQKAGERDIGYREEIENTNVLSHILVYRRVDCKRICESENISFSSLGCLVSYKEEQVCELISLT